MVFLFLIHIVNHLNSTQEILYLQNFSAIQHHFSAEEAKHLVLHASDGQQVDVSLTIHSGNKTSHETAVI